VAAGAVDLNPADEIAALEIRWAEAVQARDTGFLEHFLADEFTLTTGRRDSPVRSRDEYIAVTRESYEVDEWDFARMDVRVYGDAALVRSTYRQRGRMGEERRDTTYLMSDVLVRRASGWLAAARHISDIGA
jgi:ketosteroid isomerase-like protein